MDEVRGDTGPIYDGLASGYDRLYGRTLEWGRREGVRLMDIQPGHRVLEIGIGTGLSLPLYPIDAHVVGIDISVEMLAQARERVQRRHMPNVELYHMSGERLELEDGSFDRIFAPSVVTAMARPERALAEMARVCRPGGRVCIVGHFYGTTMLSRLADRVCDPFTRRYLGYRTVTPRSVLAGEPSLKLVTRRDILWWWNAIYLFEKVQGQAR